MQDTWKITPAPDLGLRHARRLVSAAVRFVAAGIHVPAQPVDPAKAPRLYQSGDQSRNDQRRSAFDPVTNTYLPSFDVGLEVPGTGNPFQGICQATSCAATSICSRIADLQWGPRFGFAWDVTGKQNLVIRAGGGIYYDRIQGNRIFDSVTNPPEAVSPTLNQNLVSTIDPKNVLLGPPEPGMPPTRPARFRPLTHYQTSACRRRLPWHMTLDVAYVGSQSRHLQDNRNLNYNAFGQCFLPQNQDPQLLAANPTALLGNNCLTANFLKPYPGYNSINLYESQATANYNALQMQLQRRAAKGLFFGARLYLEQGAGHLAERRHQRQLVRSPRSVQPDGQLRARPAFDRRQVLAINYVYTTPKFVEGKRFTRLITDGWQISGVTQAITGSPFTPGFSISGAGNQNITGSNTEGARIGVVAGMRSLHASERSVQPPQSGLLLRAFAGQHRSGIGHQLPLRPGRREFRHGAPEGVRGEGRRDPHSSSASTRSTSSTMRTSPATTAR